MHDPIHNARHREDATDHGAGRSDEVVQSLLLLRHDYLDRRDVKRELGGGRRRRRLRQREGLVDGADVRGLGDESVRVDRVLVSIEMRRGASTAGLDRSQNHASVMLKRRALVLRDEGLAGELVRPVRRQPQRVHRRQRFQPARGRGARPERKLADDVGEVLGGEVERVARGAGDEVQRAGHLLGQNEPGESAPGRRCLARDPADVLVWGPRGRCEPVCKRQQGIFGPVPSVRLVI